MSMVKDNSRMYPPSIGERSREEEQFSLFLARVLSVDEDRKVVTLLDEKTGTTFNEVGILPANASSVESSDVCMPEQGATCLACHLSYRGGFSSVGVVQWVLADTIKALDAVATRPLDEVEGLGTRKRGTFRKAYPGQRSVTTTEGFTERVDEAWDRTAADFTRDHVDPYRRSWTQITGRRVSYTDAGLSFSGPVNRPQADGITGRLLPDGSEEFVLYLAEGKELKKRYQEGEKDLLPLVERLDRVQEFGLDFPVPEEVLETDLLDQVLGSTRDPWERTSLRQQGELSCDDQSTLAEQDWDHPTVGNKAERGAGPTKKEGPTPRRRAFILERSEGTLVGYNRFDRGTYGKVLKPQLFPDDERFGDVTSGYNPVDASEDHVETRLAASCWSMRFPHEYNTTRFDCTKEGMLLFEVGSSLPKENVKWQGGYEHPHGAGRSVEGHLVGSMKLVVGKNRDEEEALDLQALGQVVMRLGADDSSLPDARRSVMTQNRGKADSLQKRELQYWKQAKLTPGDAGDLEKKTGAENVSLRAALDGGMIIRFGARSAKAKRRHLFNGYKDGPGKDVYGVGDKNRKDSHTPGRPTYGVGDSTYRFNDLTQAGKPKVNFPPFTEADWTDPVGDMDKQGLSVDFHAVRDVLLRLGKNDDSGQSLLMDLAGGLAAYIGKDKSGNSATATLDGGVQLVIGRNNRKKGLQIEIQGDYDVVVKGNYHLHVTGDIVQESTSFLQITKTDCVRKAQKIIDMALVRHTTEAPDIVNNQGLYKSDENT